MEVCGCLLKVWRKSIDVYPTNTKWPGVWAIHQRSIEVEKICRADFVWCGRDRKIKNLDWTADNTTVLQHAILQHYTRRKMMSKSTLTAAILQRFRTVGCKKKSIVAWGGFEPMTSVFVGRHLNHYTTETCMSKWEFLGYIYFSCVWDLWFFFCIFKLKLICCHCIGAGTPTWHWCRDLKCIFLRQSQ